MNIVTKEKTNKNKLLKRIIKAIIVLFLIFSIIIIGISSYVGLNLTKPQREGITETPKDYGMRYEDISFKSKQDDVLLKGWWIPSEKSKNEKNETVIFSHGYGDSRMMKDISGLNFAKKLTEEGYNVLTFDFRASGESEGKYSSIGQFEKEDLLSAINFVKEEKKSNEINLVGWSMGASTSILAGVESQDVKSIIADSPFYNLRNYLEENMPKWSGLPSFPFTPIILGTIPVMVGADVDKVNPTDAVKNLKDKNLLLIHSKDDKTIPYDNSELIYNAVSDKNLVDIWLTEKADHIRSYVTDKEEYENKVLSFLKNK